jgi:flagellar assembly protein FliH
MSAATDKHTAWERWELASFEAPAPVAATPAAAAEPGLPLPTASDIEAIHQQAQEQGFRAGYAEGSARARAEAEMLSALVRQLDGALAEFDGRVAEELLALAVEVARQVVGQSLAVRPEAILDAVRGALAELPHQHAAIHLHPDDALLVRTHLGESLTHAGHRILEDGQVRRGGCLIDLGGSQVDAALPTRWRRVLESIGTPAGWIAAEPP